MIYDRVSVDRGGYQPVTKGHGQVIRDKKLDARGLIIDTVRQRAVSLLASNVVVQK